MATAGLVPLGYYKDPEKSARTFRTVNGVRYSFPGDFARVEADGTITLLGRGSQCINTGGEKVYTEEVEEAVKRHEAVADCLVVGLPDERLGNRVVAVCPHRGRGGAGRRHAAGLCARAARRLQGAEGLCGGSSGATRTQREGGLPLGPCHGGGGGLGSPFPHPWRTGHPSQGTTSKSLCFRAGPESA